MYINIIYIYTYTYVYIHTIYIYTHTVIYTFWKDQDIICVGLSDVILEMKPHEAFPIFPCTEIPWFWHSNGVRSAGEKHCWIPSPKISKKLT